MELSDPVLAPRQEKAASLLCLTPVSVFALFVLLHERVSLFEYGKLSVAFLGIAAMMVGGAFTCFVLAELARTGVVSGWKASPSSAISSAVAGRWREDRLFSLAWPIALFLLLLPSFNAFKQRILPSAGFVHDKALAALDRALFGADPGLLLHEWVGSPALTRFLDAVYHSWFLPTMLGVCVVGLCAGTRTRAQYMLSYSAVWIVLGAILAFALPAAGPAFYQTLVDTSGAEPFTAIEARLAAAGGGGHLLTSLGNQTYLLRNLDAPALVIGGGISALPSIHNAMSTLLALAAFRVGKWLGIAMIGYALMIWVASVYLNWHYAVDGLAGAAGAMLLWWTSGWAVDLALASGNRGGRSVRFGARPLPSLLPQR
jgi:hypothetical protein